MKIKTQIINRIEKKEKELVELKKQLDSFENKLNILNKITYKNKEFQVIEWTKPIKDFPYPKDFSMTEFQEFNELIEKDKIKLETWKYYFVKHFNKKQWNKEYCLSGVSLDSNGNLNSNNDNLAYSYVSVRVVICKELNKGKKK